MATLEIPGHFLNDGMYSVGVSVTHYSLGIHGAFFERGVLTFNIVDRNDENGLRAISRWGGRIPGAVRPLLRWEVEETGRMKAVILAGGLGTRISEETHLKPKPMIEIGGQPILWHIMKIYSAHGVNDFVICCGYQGYVIKEYFANYFLHMSDVTFDMADNKMEFISSDAEPWKSRSSTPATTR